MLAKFQLRVEEFSVYNQIVQMDDLKYDVNNYLIQNFVIQLLSEQLVNTFIY